jgi:hypothetical protein
VSGYFQNGSASSGLAADNAAAFMPPGTGCAFVVMFRCDTPIRGTPLDGTRFDGMSRPDLRRKLPVVK